MSKSNKKKHHVKNYPCKSDPRRIAKRKEKKKKTKENLGENTAQIHRFFSARHQNDSQVHKLIRIRAPGEPHDL